MMQVRNSILYFLEHLLMQMEIHIKETKLMYMDS